MGRQVITQRDIDRDQEKENLVDPIVMPPVDIRLCVARLRSALNKVISFPSIPINQSDAARLMNETGDIALKYRCYEDEIV